MKPEVTRQNAVVTITTHDENPLPTPLLDAAVDRLMFPLLHQIIDRQEERATKPKLKYHYENVCECGQQSRYSVCHPVRKVRVYHTD